MLDRSTGVYLLHLASPLSGSRAQHYIGYSRDVRARILSHQAGHGARFTRAAVNQHIPFDVVRFWPCPTMTSAMYVERSLKRRHNHADYCPICQARRELGFPQQHRPLVGRTVSPKV